MYLFCQFCLNNDLTKDLVPPLFITHATGRGDRFAKVNKQIIWENKVNTSALYFQRSTSTANWIMQYSCLCYSYIILLMAYILYVFMLHGNNTETRLKVSVVCLQSAFNITDTEYLLFKHTGLQQVTWLKSETVTTLVYIRFHVAERLSYERINSPSNSYLFFN